MFHCDLKYLQALIDSILLLRKDCLRSKNENAKFESCVKRMGKSLAAIGYEIDRLDKHPELFPSETTRHEFFGFVYRIFRDWNTAFDGIKAIQMEHKDLFQELFNARRQLFRDAYSADRKPWQQYLHNKAPGSGYDPGEMDPEGSTQIIPMGAARLYDSHVRVCKEIREKIEAVSALPRICALTEKTRN